MPTVPLLRSAPVTGWTIASCVVATIPALLFPRVYEALDSTGAWPWQPMSAAFTHGAPGFRAVGAVHLALSLAMIALCGPPVERVLGAWRFQVTTAAALAAFAVAGAWSGIDGMGASIFYYAWLPALAVVVWARARARPGVVDAFRERATGLLVILWVVVTPMMTGVPYLFGYRGSVVDALLGGNLFHGTATTAGALAAWMWRRRLAGREALADDPQAAGSEPRTLADRLAIWAGAVWMLVLGAAVAIRVFG